MVERYIALRGRSGGGAGTPERWWRVSSRGLAPGEFQGFSGEVGFSLLCQTFEHYRPMSLSTLGAKQDEYKGGKTENSI